MVRSSFVHPLDGRKSMDLEIIVQLAGNEFCFGAAKKAIEALDNDSLNDISETKESVLEALNLFWDATEKETTGFGRIVYPFRSKGDSDIIWVATNELNPELASAMATLNQLSSVLLALGADA